MTQRILEILDNVRYWETCPDAYKQDIETFLNSQTEQLDLPVVSVSVCEKCHKDEQYAGSPLCKECLLGIYDKAN